MVDVHSDFQVYLQDPKPYIPEKKTNRGPKCTPYTTDAKSECGMADYQVKKWSAWHHRTALVMMAMLFMLFERIRHEDEYPLLSCADIEELPAHFLPRRNMTKKEVLSQNLANRRSNISGGQGFYMETIYPKLEGKIPF